VKDYWITKDGFLDPLKLPLSPILSQALQEDEELFRAGCAVLSCIASRGGREAGVFLLGLLTHYRERPMRLGTIVSALSAVPTPATVEALAGELYRVESTIATRRYLGDVLRALTRLPRELWESKLSDLAQDTHFSPRWRRKFEDALELR
jgi:hypothetical protein